VEQVDVPGAEGDFGVLAGHAPLVATLRPGVLTIYESGGAKRLFVRDGFAEVNPAGLTVLAEVAVPIEELNAGLLQSEIEAAEVRLAEAKDGSAKDKAAERVDQLKQVRGQLGAATPSSH